MRDVAGIGPGRHHRRNERALGQLLDELLGLGLVNLPRLPRREDAAELLLDLVLLIGREVRAIDDQVGREVGRVSREVGRLEIEIDRAAAAGDQEQDQDDEPAAYAGEAAAPLLRGRLLPVGLLRLTVPRLAIRRLTGRAVLRRVVRHR